MESSDDDPSRFFPEEDTPPWSECGELPLQEPLSPPFRPVVPDSNVNHSHWSNHPWFSRVVLAVDPPPVSGASAMVLDFDVNSALSPMDDR